MKLTDYIDPEAVVDLTQTTADSVIVEMVEAAHRVYQFEEPADRIIEVVQARERLGSTAITGGHAIPHAQFIHLDREVIVVGRSREGVDFKAPDGEPVKVFFLLLGRREASGRRDVKKHLELLATIAGVCKSEAFLEHCLEVETPAELYDLIKRSGPPS